KLYTRPAQCPPIFGAALSEETAAWMGGWADGLITTGAPRDALASLIGAFSDGGGEGKPVKVQAALAWAPTADEAVASAHSQWRGNVLGTALLAELERPRDFARAAAGVTASDVAAGLVVSHDPAVHAERLREYVEAGASDVYLFNVAPWQREFLE